MRVQCGGRSANMPDNELMQLLQESEAITIYKGGVVLIVGYDNEDIYLEIEEEIINE